MPPGFGSSSERLPFLSLYSSASGRDSFFSAMFGHLVAKSALRALYSAYSAGSSVSGKIALVGHTGSLAAAVKAAEVVDACVGRVLDATKAAGGCAIVTADHGNFEQMYDPTTHGPHTAHTVGDVPLIVMDERYVGRRMRADDRPPQRRP